MKKIFFIFSFFIIFNLLTTTKIMAGCVPCPTVKLCTNSSMTSGCRNLTVGNSTNTPAGIYGCLYHKQNSVLMCGYYLGATQGGSDKAATVYYKACDAIGNIYIYATVETIPNQYMIYNTILDKNSNLLLGHSYQINS